MVQYWTLIPSALNFVAIFSPAKSGSQSTTTTEKSLEEPEATKHRICHTYGAWHTRIYCRRSANSQMSWLFDHLIHTGKKKNTKLSPLIKSADFSWIRICAFKTLFCQNKSISSVISSLNDDKLSISPFWNISRATRLTWSIRKASDLIKGRHFVKKFKFGFRRKMNWSPIVMRSWASSSDSVKSLIKALIASSNTFRGFDQFKKSSLWVVNVYK